MTPQQQHEGSPTHTPTASMGIILSIQAYLSKMSEAFQYMVHNKPVFTCQKVTVALA